MPTSPSDLAGDGGYSATVISDAFAGKTRVQQHQMVYQALKGRMGGELHALALQTSAPKVLQKYVLREGKGPDE